MNISITCDSWKSTSVKFQISTNSSWGCSICFSSTCHIEFYFAIITLPWAISFCFYFSEYVSAVCLSLRLHLIVKWNLLIIMCYRMYRIQITQKYQGIQIILFKRHVVAIYISHSEMCDVCVNWLIHRYVCINFWVMSCQWIKLVINWWKRLISEFVWILIILKHPYPVITNVEMHCSKTLNLPLP